MSLRASEVFAPQPRKRGNPEPAIQRAIVKYLRLRGCLVAVTDAGAAYRAGAFFGEAIPAGLAGCHRLIAQRQVHRRGGQGAGWQAVAGADADGTGDPRAQWNLCPRQERG